MKHRGGADSQTKSTSQQVGQSSASRDRAKIPLIGQKCLIMDCSSTDETLDSLERQKNWYEASQPII
jgi:hypothetical protein